MLGVNVITADTEEEAKRHATSLTQAFLNLRRGKRLPIAPPVDPEKLEAEMLPHERAMLEEIFRCSFVGTPEKVAQDLRAFAKEKTADELIVASMVFDHDARKKSYELLAKAF